jgi:hypothetical protein
VNKSEAIAVLREIFAACPEINHADFVSLDPDNLSVNSKGIYTIRLRVNLDRESKEAIKAVLDKHKLEMTVTKDLVVIHRERASQ